MMTSDLHASLQEDYDRAKRELECIKEDVRSSGPRHIEFALDQLWLRWQEADKMIIDLRAAAARPDEDV